MSQNKSILIKNRLSNKYLCFYHNGSVYYYGLWVLPLYFKNSKTVLVIKLNDGKFYYAPLFYSKIYSDTARNLQIRFYRRNIPYFMFFHKKTPFDGFDTVSISLGIIYKYGIISVLTISFGHNVGDLQRIALKYRIHIKVISSSGGEYYENSKIIQPTFLEDFDLYKDTSKDQRLFDSEVDGFKNYESYEECNETYLYPRIPNYEIIRISCDVSSGYYDVKLDYTETANRSFYINIPIREGETWSTG